MLVLAAVVPTPPLLVPEIAGGSAARDEMLRQHCLAAVAALVTAAPDVVVVVGSAARSGPARGTWDWSPVGVPVRGQPELPALPLALAVGDWLLDRSGWGGRREHIGVSGHADVVTCREIGAQIAASPDRVALLVCGDGTACRSQQAPGYLDPRAEAFDAAVSAALAGADTDTLLRLDEELARHLLATGRAAWQVLGGAAGGRDWAGTVTYDAAPYGVGYFVALWRPRG